MALQLADYVVNETGFRGRPRRREVLRRRYADVRPRAVGGGA